MSKKQKSSSKQKWHAEILTKQATTLLKSLSDNPDLLEDFYLVGGTALSLYLGHRISVDFDFFTKKEFETRIISRFKSVSDDLHILNATPNSVEFIIDDVKMFLWTNYYPLIQPLNRYNSIAVASLLDIGLLKIIALEGRSTWKDIVDLYFLDQEISLEKIAAEYFKTYPQGELNEYSRLKIILNENEISKSPKPKMLIDIDFELARKAVTQKLIHIFSDHINVQ